MLGVATNVLVAWGLACRDPVQRRIGVQSDLRARFAWPLAVPSEWPSGIQPGWGCERRSIGQIFGVYVGECHDRESGYSYFGMVGLSAGWPMHAMIVSREDRRDRFLLEIGRDYLQLGHGYNTSPLSTHIEVLAPGPVFVGIAIPDRLRVRHGLSAAIPLMPILPGFVVNTAFFAGVIAMGWLGARGLRRWRRARRGRCPTCGYSMVGLGLSVPCPECGAFRGVRRPTLTGSGE